MWLSAYGISRSESDSTRPVSRSGATMSAPPGPVWAIRTETTYLPRRCGGSAATSGYGTAAKDEVGPSGTVRVQASYARGAAAGSTVRPSKASEPPYSVRTGTSPVSSSVTMPRFWPAPSSARYGSGSESGVTRRSLPSAVTSSSHRTWSAA